MIQHRCLVDWESQMLVLVFWFLAFIFPPLGTGCLFLGVLDLVCPHCLNDLPFFLLGVVLGLIGLVGGGLLRVTLGVDLG